MSLSDAAIVLRRTAFGEADVVVTVLTRRSGRVAALAKSARKSQRRFSGGFGLGARGDVQLRERNGSELMLCESFETTDARVALGEDLGRTAHAAYALELCDRLCPVRHPEPDVFDWLEEFLVRLERGAALTSRLRVFEIGLLKRLGIGPMLSACVRCGTRDFAEPACRFIAEEGGVHCRSCARAGLLLPADAQRALARLEGTSLLEAETEVLAKEVNSACRNALLEVIRQHIQGPLKSIEFINKLGG